MAGATMQSIRMGGVAAAALCLLLASPAGAADRKYILPDAARTVEGGRDVRVLLTQPEIAPEINVSNVVVATGGGLIGVMIDAKVNSDRTKRAEGIIAPVRNALAGLDVEAMAMTATRSLAERAPWLDARGVTLGRDGSMLGMIAVLDAAPTSQVAFVEYVYDLSPDFSAIRVSVTQRFLNKAVPDGKKPDSRLFIKYAAYWQTATAVVVLPSPSKDPAENAARWAADDGALARKALELAFQDAAALAARSYDLKEEELKPMNAKDKKYEALGGYGGRVQEDGPDGLLLFTGSGFVRVRTLAQ